MSLLAKARERVLKSKGDKKGFTLVELIVVIVIIAILAAITVPSLVGYIDRAKNQQILADGRSAYVASQALATENYAKGTKSGSVDETEILKLAGLTGKGTVSATSTDGKITAFSYKDGSATNKEVTLDTSGNLTIK